MTELFDIEAQPSEPRAYGRPLVVALVLLASWSVCGALLYFDRLLHESNAIWQPSLGIIGIGIAVFATFAVIADWSDRR